MIINLLSFPRSGNSFVTSLIGGLEPVWLASGLKVQAHACGLTPNLEGIYPQSDRRSNDISSAELEDPNNVYICKSHDADWVFPGSKNIVIIRNGVHAIFSWVDYHLKLNKINVNLKTLRAEAIRKIEEEDWSMRVAKYLAHPGTVATVRYEELNLDVVQAALQKCGFETTRRKAGPLTFGDLHQGDSTHFAVGHARKDQHLFPDLEEWFIARHRTRMQQLGYL